MGARLMSLCPFVGDNDKDDIGVEGRSLFGCLYIVSKAAKALDELGLACITDPSYVCRESSCVGVA